MHSLTKAKHLKRPFVKSFNICNLPGPLNAITDVAGVKVGHFTLIAATGPVPEGNVGAGAGTICFGFKGGIGTASRKLPDEDGGYTVGVLVQTNFGGVLQVDGLPVGEELRKKKAAQGSGDGSCMIVVATDAPADARNLNWR